VLDPPEVLLLGSRKEDAVTNDRGRGICVVGVETENHAHAHDSSNRGQRAWVARNPVWSWMEAWKPPW